MTKSELLSIKESISRIERFAVGYPKRVECCDPKWQKFFGWEYDLCLARQKEIFAANVDNGENQMKLVV